MRIRLGQLRRLIRESIEISSLAALQPHSGPGSARIVVYDAGKLKTELLSARNMEAVEDAVGRAVRGYIWIRDPNQMSQKRGACRGAWEVVASYFPGGGELLYKLAFAIAPAGLLMSDREEVSPGAQSRWRKIADTHHGEEFDDIKHRPGHDNHTEDPNDDCVCWDEDGMKYLNAAYKADGTEKALLKTLEDKHEVVREFILRLIESEKLPDGFDLKEALLQAAMDKFSDSLKS
jgi:hypothetical protein